MKLSTDRSSLVQDDISASCVIVHTWKHIKNADAYHLLTLRRREEVAPPCIRKSGHVFQWNRYLEDVSIWVSFFFTSACTLQTRHA